MIKQFLTHIYYYTTHVQSKICCLVEFITRLKKVTNNDNDNDKNIKTPTQQHH